MTTTTLDTTIARILTALDNDSTTCMAVLEEVQAYRWAHPSDGVADAITDAVRTWHAAYARRMQEWWRQV